MKARSKERLKEVEVVRIEKKACVILRENFKEAEDGFRFDEYQIETTYRDNLEETIRLNLPDWLDMARKEEQIRLQKMYEERTLLHIRLKYSQDDENKITREYLAYPEDESKKASFQVYNWHVEESKKKAREEIYGEA